jgi:ferritin-like metal-binding protein YciE
MLNQKETRHMGLFTTPIKTLDDLFLHTLQDVYYAENQITKALPLMIGKAHNPALKQGFTTHLQETEQHIKRLDEVFAALKQTPKGVTCEAIDGIIKEAKQVVSDVEDPAVRDVALVLSAQAVEHYEIARYGSLIALANQLGHQQVVKHLQLTLEEEKAADRKLTQVSDSHVNKKAA